MTDFSRNKLAGIPGEEQTVLRELLGDGELNLRNGALFFVVNLLKTEAFAEKARRILFSPIPDALLASATTSDSVTDL
jgi:hypothetical protein